MDFTNDRRLDEITYKYANVCDRMMRMLDRIAVGDAPAPSEIEELSAEVEVLRTTLRPPQCAYDFVPSVPRCLN